MDWCVGRVGQQFRMAGTEGKLYIVAFLFVRNDFLV